MTDQFVRTEQGTMTHMATSLGDGYYRTRCGRRIRGLYISKPGHHHQCSRCGQPADYDELERVRAAEQAQWLAEYKARQAAEQERADLEWEWIKAATAEVQNNLGYDYDMKRLHPDEAAEDTLTTRFIHDGRWFRMTIQISLEE